MQATTQGTTWEFGLRWPLLSKKMASTGQNSSKSTHSVFIIVPLQENLTVPVHLGSPSANTQAIGSYGFSTEPLPCLHLNPT